MNAIESAAARHLPDAEGGTIRPLEMALERSPSLTALVITPTYITPVHHNYFIVVAGEEAQSSYMPGGGAAGSYEDMAVDELISGRQSLTARN